MASKGINEVNNKMDAVLEQLIEMQNKNSNALERVDKELADIRNTTAKICCHMQTLVSKQIAIDLKKTLPEVTKIPVVKAEIFDPDQLIVWMLRNFGTVNPTDQELQNLFGLDDSSYGKVRKMVLSKKFDPRFYQQTMVVMIHRYLPSAAKRQPSLDILLSKYSTVHHGLKSSEYCQLTVGTVIGTIQAVSDVYYST